MSISICGDIGSGKSTVAKLLAERLGYEVVDSGQLYREYAASKSYDVLQLNESGDRSIDVKIDTHMQRLNETRKDIIYVSRTAWNLLPDVFSVYLGVNPVTAAMRVVGDKRNSESHTSIEETLQFNEDRMASELKRYKDMYGWTAEDRWNQINMYLYIGTRSAGEVTDAIVSSYLKKQKRCVVVDPKEVLPSQVLRDYSVDVVNEYRNNIATCLNGTILVEYDGEIFCVLDGHHRLAACCQENIPFVPVQCNRVTKLTCPIARPDYYDVEDYIGGHYENLLLTLDRRKRKTYDADVWHSYTVKYSVTDERSELERLLGLYNVTSLGQLVPCIEKDLL